MEITLLPEDPMEGDQTFFVTLTTPSDPDLVEENGENAVTTITIVNDDGNYPDYIRTRHPLINDRCSLFCTIALKCFFQSLI